LQRAVESLRLNSLREKRRRGRLVICKTRNLTAGWVASTTNVFFRLAGLPIRYCTDLAKWQQREVECFNMLNDPYRGTRSALARFARTSCPVATSIAISSQARSRPRCWKQPGVKSGVLTAFSPTSSRTGGRMAISA
jgi:hypothetical protein